MRFVQLGAAAALAGVSQAFLLPPTVSDTDAKLVDVIPFEAEALADGRVMEVNCPGCSVNGANSAETVLRLNFTVSHEAGDRLMLNGLQVYPIDRTADTYMKPLTADQLMKDSDNTWSYVRSPELGYSLSYKHPMVESTENKLSLVAIHLKIIEVDNQFIEAIPQIELRLVETPSGNIMIGDAEIQSRPPPPHHGQECTTLVCKWKAIIAGKIQQANHGAKKGCGSKNKFNGPPRVSGFRGGPPPRHGHGQGRPHRGPHHGALRGHRHHSRFGGFLRGLVLHIVVPMLIGVAVGITASLVGMVVGHIAIFFWRLFFRRGERGQYATVEQEDVEDESDEYLEKEALVDSPPVYEEAVLVAEEKPVQK